MPFKKFTRSNGNGLVRSAPSHQIKMPITRVVPDLKIAYIITIRFVLILERRPFISKVIY